MGKKVLTMEDGQIKENPNFKPKQVHYNNPGIIKRAWHYGVVGFPQNYKVTKEDQEKINELFEKKEEEVVGNFNKNFTDIDRYNLKVIGEAGEIKELDELEFLENNKVFIRLFKRRLRSNSGLELVTTSKQETAGGKMIDKMDQDVRTRKGVVYKSNTEGLDVGDVVIVSPRAMNPANARTLTLQDIDLYNADGDIAFLLNKLDVEFKFKK